MRPSKINIQLQLVVQIPDLPLVLMQEFTKPQALVASCMATSSKKQKLVRFVPESAVETFGRVGVKPTLKCD